MIKQEIITTLSEIKEDLPIIPVVSGQVCDSDYDYGFYFGNIACIEVGEWTRYNGHIYTRDEEEDLATQFILDYPDDNEFANLDDAEFDNWVKSKLSKLDWHKSIFVHVGEYKGI